jgi:hypothetical protein
LGWLVVNGWCWFVLREEYCWLVANGWFVLRERYCWLVGNKPSEQPVCITGDEFTVLESISLRGCHVGIAFFLN